jgi:hypothetical protein
MYSERIELPIIFQVVLIDLTRQEFTTSRIKEIRARALSSACFGKASLDVMVFSIAVITIRKEPG